MCNSFENWTPADPEIETCEVDLDPDNPRLLKGFVELDLTCRQCGDSVFYKTFEIKEQITRRCCGNPSFEVLVENEWATPEESRLVDQPVRWGFSWNVKLRCVTCAETFTHDLYEVSPLSGFISG